MCRFIDEGEPELQVCGVLTEYDLSSWTEDLKKYHAKMSKELIGTPPYMACELLDGTGSVHLYRHDVESLFYIMLMICGRRTIGPQGVLTREGNLPYQRWLDEWDHETLGCIKSSFITCEEYIELSSTVHAISPSKHDVGPSFWSHARKEATKLSEAAINWEPVECFIFFLVRRVPNFECS